MIFIFKSNQCYNPGCCCQNTVETCSVENIPVYQQCNTHHVHNCIKNYVQTPVYTQTYETKYFDYVSQGAPLMGNAYYYQGYPNMNAYPFQAEQVNPQANMNYNGFNNAAYQQNLMGNI